MQWNYGPRTASRGRSYRVCVCDLLGVVLEMVVLGEVAWDTPLPLPSLLGIGMGHTDRRGRRWPLGFWPLGLWQLGRLQNHGLDLWQRRTVQCEMCRVHTRAG